MDTISATDDALRNACVILQQLGESSNSITSKCVQQLSSELSSLDEKFRGEIQLFIETINELEKRLKYCIDENITAIGDRLNKIQDYESKTYKKRNFV